MDNRSFFALNWKSKVCSPGAVGVPAADELGRFAEQFVRKKAATRIGEKECRLPLFAADNLSVPK